MAGTVLITGGGGFIGSHVVRHVIGAGHVARVLERPGASTDHLPTQRVELVEADIRDPARVATAAAGCEWVLHLAANPNLWVADPDEFEAVNHQGTRHVLAAARQAGAGRVVHVSTESILTSGSSTRGDASDAAPIDEATTTRLNDQIGPYCRSKWLAEQAARSAQRDGEPVVIVSPTIPVGPGDVRRGPLSRLMCDFAGGRVRAYLDAELDLIDVRDAAAGVWAAARHGEPGRRYLLAGERWRVTELLAVLSRLTGVPAPRRRVPYPVALAFAHLEQWWCRWCRPGEPMATVTGVKLTRRAMRFDDSATRRELGLARRPVDRAIEEAMEWFRDRGVIPAGGAYEAA